MDGLNLSPFGWNQKGLNLAQSGRVQESIRCFRAAVELDPEFAEAQNNLGAALLALEQFRDASVSLQAALLLNPTNADTHFNLGIASWRNGDRDASLTHFTNAISLQPRLADAHYNLGILCAEKGRFEEAIDCFRKTIALLPNFAPAHANLGTALAYIDRNDEAIQSFGRALDLAPADANSRAQRMHLLAANCDWDSLAPDLHFVPTLGVSDGIVPPFGMLALEDNPERHLVRAKRFSAAKYVARPAPLERPAARPQRLKIGYFSADFREHPSMQLAMALFDSHDRERFSIHAYSYGPPAGEAMRERLVNTFESFTDVAPLTDADVAAKVRADRLDIAIDLQGHTLFSRLGIFAHRAAPLQVTFLGYPGTTGAPFMDYLVADHTVIADKARDAFSERLIVLPHSYQPNDRRLKAAGTWTRAQAGLPKIGFVFCCFNNSYKITPREFDIWMDMLRSVDESCLWLLSTNSHVEANLRKEAKRRDIDPARLVFAPRVPADEHIARHQLADLFLDTFAYNAHTTASDALWMGLPVVTKLGKGFAARVAASLLRTVGLPELVTESEDQYVDLALRLAREPERLAAIRKRLIDRGRHSPLFDGPLFARHLEAGLDAAFDRLMTGEPAADIQVETQEAR